MACRQLIVGAPELIVFYGDVVREHLLFHKPAFTLAYERYQGQRGPIQEVALVDAGDIVHSLPSDDPDTDEDSDHSLWPSDGPGPASPFLKTCEEREREEWH